MQLGPDQEGGNATLVLVVGGHGLVAAPDAENEISFLRGVGKNIFKVFKGLLISKCPFGVIVWTKIPMKNLTNFCPKI